jgi:hypothetical protein
VLQDLDPARQAAHAISLGLPMGFPGESARAISRADVPS